MELKELIEKWEEQIAMHRRVVEDPLMWTKEDRQKSSHQTQALCAIMDDIKKLSIPRVVGRSEQLSLSTGGCYNCPKCGKGLHVSDYDHNCEA